MQSLLHLPQNIWRDNVMHFLPKIEDLARLDSAAVNKTDRIVYLANISGCKRFTHYRFHGNNEKMQWLASRSIIVEVLQFSEEPDAKHRPYIQKLLPCTRAVQFSQKSLSQNEAALHWVCSDKLSRLCFESSSVGDVSACQRAAVWSVCKSVTVPKSSTKASRLESQAAPN